MAGTVVVVIAIVIIVAKRVERSHDVRGNQGRVRTTGISCRRIDERAGGRLEPRGEIDVNGDVGARARYGKRRIEGAFELGMRRPGVSERVSVERPLHAYAYASKIRMRRFQLLQFPVQPVVDCIV